MAEKKTLHFRLGENIGMIMLDIAQNNITSGNFDKAISTYTDAFHGFTKEHAMMLLKGKCVLVPTEDGCSVNLTNDPEEMEKQAMYLTDWWHEVKKLVESLDALRSGANELNNKVRKFYIDLNDVNLTMLAETEALAFYVERYIAGENLVKGKHNVFHNMLDNGDFDFESLTTEKKILYCVVRYFDCIKYMHKDFVTLARLYDFLRENEMVEHYPLIEHTFERTLENYLEGFLDKSNSYHGSLCNDKLNALKDEMMQQVMSTKWGKEYFENGIIAKDMLDKYDAGYLAPDGRYYALLGETRNLLHVQLSDMLCKKLYPELRKNPTLDKEYELMKMGFMKVHHDNIYGYFAYNKKEAEEGGRAYCPTEVQVNAIYEYAKKYYGGMINVDGTGRHMVSVSAIRQMDEIALRELFRA